MQNSDVRLTAGNSSSGDFTRRALPIKEATLWDQAKFVLRNVAVAGGDGGGSYIITLEIDVLGFTALPVARATLGPNSPSTVEMENLHQSPAAPMPTHMHIKQTAPGGGLTLACEVVAKQFTKKSQTYAFVLGTNGAGQWNGKWRRALAWAVADTVTGSHDVDLIANVDGERVSVASGAINAADRKVALRSNFYDKVPNPSDTIWTEVEPGGVSNPNIIVLAGKEPRAGTPGGRSRGKRVVVR